MRSNPPTNATVAFELLLAEIEEEIELLNQAGANALFAANCSKPAEAALLALSDWLF